LQLARLSIAGHIINAYTVTAGDVGALTTLGTFDPTDQESKMMGGHLDQMAPSQEPLGMSGLNEGADGQ
jgi:hypothetical protein